VHECSWATCLQEVCAPAARDAHERVALELSSGSTQTRAPQPPRTIDELLSREKAREDDGDCDDCAHCDTRENIALNREHGAHAHLHTTRLGMSTSPTAVRRSGGFAHCTVPHTRERAMAAAQATTRNLRENDMIVGVLATTCSARENIPRLGCWLPKWTMQRANKTRERESGSGSGRRRKEDRKEDGKKKSAPVVRSRCSSPPPCGSLRRVPINTHCTCVFSSNRARPSLNVPPSHITCDERSATVCQLRAQRWVLQYGAAVRLRHTDTW
jgi:hypothetical protein